MRDAISGTLTKKLEIASKCYAKGSDALERRPQLAAALAEARRKRCSKGVAKLDRLSRDVHFISGLMAANKAAADQHAANVCQSLDKAKAPGTRTLREIADALNERGFQTARGRQYATTVSDVLARA